jgi:hypothetical protein
MREHASNLSGGGPKAGKLRRIRLADSVPPLFQAKTFWEVQAFISR